MNGTGITAPYT